jgi:DNA-binding transcriptional ArsR family regulator
MSTAADNLFRSLADPTRRALFERLSRSGPQTVVMLTGKSGVSQPAVSKHLRVLKRAGLVRSRHQGRETHYSARPEGLAQLFNWIEFYSSYWNSAFDRLESLLERMEE